MKLGIRNQKDFAAGLIYMAAGSAFAIGALNYKVGEAARMGPGYFPLAVGILLAIVGMITAAQGLRANAAAEEIRKPSLAVMAWVLGAVVLFALLLQPMGLVAALAALILVSSRASHEFSWRGALAATVVLILFCTAVFIWGISLQIPLWPRFVAA